MPSPFATFNLKASRALNRRGIYLGRRSAKIHAALYRASGGRLGGHLPGWRAARIALVDHVGAKSGKVRTSPVMYLGDGEALVITASNGAQPTNPNWFHNLMANPDTTVRIRREVRPVHARRADRAETDRLWPELDEMYPGFEFFRIDASPREIPVVILEPRQADPTGAEERPQR